MLKENDVQKSVFEKIHKGEVFMRPKYYFVARLIVIGVLAVLALAFSIFSLSFAIFSIHESGEQFLLGFGKHGLVTFVTLFPWLAVLVSIALLVLLEALTRNFRFAYRVPLLRVFLWALVIAVIGSLLVGLTPFHSLLLDKADKDELPIIGPLYEQVHDSHQPQGVYRGDVTSITGTRFTISHNDSDRDSDEGTWLIEAPAGFDMSTVSVGEHLYVAGRLLHGIVYAYGIHVLEDQQ